MKLSLREAMEIVHRPLWRRGDIFWFQMDRQGNLHIHLTQEAKQLAHVLDAARKNDGSTIVALADR